MKKILITGVNSYVGSGFKEWMEQFPGLYNISTISLRDSRWREKSFSEYDVILHVAGIAHADVGNVSEERKRQYYKVNTDLTLEVAKKAKEDGVGQLLFMSSIIVYDISSSIKEAKIITKDTVPKPTNFYGDSKLQAEKGLALLTSENFKVAIIRPPMIYGKNSKGNYPLLAKLAKKLPVFPDVKNERSMLFINNLCEFIRLIIDNKENGTFFPQNKEYVKTSELVKLIAMCHGKKIWITSLLNVFVRLIGYIPGKPSELVNKAFGNLVYDKSLSFYEKGNYRISSLEESVKQTEG
ncbi:NAD-dependent epimerase/dehydratase family protein [Guptibacillus hwajinpoensis]|uniref:NAD-dependent epimerase n=1 Tax=Guptibacillus hwajinpoensis TaxID=208199 RepID=A0A0J6CUK6_9BACL|nr:NAD-dependent epimerase/dehydratase family protein [Alkalihalobacillus macyae]KMM36745.1 NAD-dependent epimerase [Alkalihalobacillus macyae]